MTSREDTTCYLERSEVRKILIGHNAATQAVLPKIDALPIFTAADIAGAAQQTALPVNTEALALADRLARMPMYYHDHQGGGPYVEIPDGMRVDLFSVLRNLAQASPSRKQIEAVIDDYLGNIDATYEDSRQRCAQRIVDLYAVTSTTLGSAAK